jgi:4-amino-4-deoxy-L-arabinose transferase-like glycosyltransferase
MAVILLGFETLWLLSARRAMSDVFGIIFSIAGILLFLVYANSKDFRALLLCGIAQGLALASKYNAVFGLVATAILLLILSKERFSVRDLAVNEVVLFGSSIVLLLLLNPFFYPDPIHGALTLAKFMSGGFGFASLSPAQSNPFETLLGIVGSLFVPVSWHLYPGTYTTLALSVLFSVGFVKLVLQLRCSNKNTDAIVLLTWFCTYVVGLSLTDRAIYISRYFLPLIPLISLIAAYGLSILVKGMSPRLSALTVSLLTLSMVFNVLAFYPEFYQAAWGNPVDWPGGFGTLQQSVLRPLGIMSVGSSVVLLAIIAIHWRGLIASITRRTFARVDRLFSR